MQSIGERLEEARKRKGISIREAAEATKIRSDYLHKFESNQYDIRLPEIYVRGFLRSYSNFLKLPADKIIADYNAISHGEPKSGRSVSREIYGRMDISTSKEPKPGREPGAPSTGNTTPPMTAQPAAAAPTETMAPRNPATFVPPHSTGSPIDKKLIIKAGIIAAAVALIIILLILLVSGRGSRTTTPPATTTNTTTTTPTELWIRPQGSEPTVVLFAKSGAVRVTVTAPSTQAGVAPIMYYQGTIPMGESRSVPRRGALLVETDQFDNLEFGINGQMWPMPKQRTAKINPPQ